MSVPGENDTWLHRQQRREERMRFEVLAALYQACGGRSDCVLTVADFAQELGIWREELFRVLEFLDRKGYLRYLGAGPQVSLTPSGIDYIENGARRRRSLRD